MLITGETGTGKELIARAIHSASNRKDKPLIKFNCAAFPAGLVESELLRTREALLHGERHRPAQRPASNSPTEAPFFWTRLARFPLETQVKLLRVLQEPRNRAAWGGGAPIKVDIRILAASNRDLLKAVHEKTFREDLYYRPQRVPHHATAVAGSRKEDIPLLVHFLVRKFATRIGKHIDDVTVQTMRQLIDYSWPGNVRELENVLERAVILTTGTTVSTLPDLLPLTDAGMPAVQQQLTLESVEPRLYRCPSCNKPTGWSTGARGAARIPRTAPE